MNWHSRLREGAAALLRLPLPRGLLLATIENLVDGARAYKFATRRDPLTGCLSGSYFRERLQRRMGIPGSQLMLALIETSSNEGIAIALADLLRRRLRETDDIARFGEAFFAIAMEESPSKPRPPSFTAWRRNSKLRAGCHFVPLWSRATDVTARLAGCATPVTGKLLGSAAGLDRDRWR